LQKGSQNLRRFSLNRSNPSVVGALLFNSTMYGFYAKFFNISILNETFIILQMLNCTHVINFRKISLPEFLVCASLRFNLIPAMLSIFVIEMNHCDLSVPKFSLTNTLQLSNMDKSPSSNQTTFIQFIKGRAIEYKFVTIKCWKGHLTDRFETV